MSRPGSLTRLHKARVKAEQEAQRSGESGARSVMQGSEHEFMLAALWADRRRLKDIKSIQAKIVAKRDLLPKYAPYIAGVMAAQAGVQDEVLMTVMAWRLDVRDLEGALEIGEYAIRHGLSTPDRFERDTPSLLLEQTSEEVLRMLEEADGRKDGEPWPAHIPPAETLARCAMRAMEATDKRDMHDQIRAKGWKAIGYALRATGSPKYLRPALDALQEALRLNDRCGVKKDIERLERALAAQGHKNAADPGSHPGTGQ